MIYSSHSGQSVGGEGIPKELKRDRTGLTVSEAFPLYVQNSVIFLRNGEPCHNFHLLFALDFSNQ